MIHLFVCSYNCLLVRSFVSSFVFSFVCLLARSGFAFSVSTLFCLPYLFVYFFTFLQRGFHLFYLGFFHHGTTAGTPGDQFMFNNQYTYSVKLEDTIMTGYLRFCRCNITFSLNSKYAAELQRLLHNNYTHASNDKKVCHIPLDSFGSDDFANPVIRFSQGPSIKIRKLWLKIRKKRLIATWKTNDFSKLSNSCYCFSFACAACMQCKPLQIEIKQGILKDIDEIFLWRRTEVEMVHDDTVLDKLRLDFVMRMELGDLHKHRDIFEINYKCTLWP